MAKPLQHKNSANNISSNNILWDGPNIPCLDLCTGDTVSNTVYKIAQKVCTMVDDLEALKTLTFDCLIDCPSSCDPKDYSLKAIFEVLLANDCKLQDAISQVEQSVSTGGVVLGNLDLSCLESHMINLCVDPTKYTLNDIFQCFINIICDHETRIVDIINRIQSLEVLITNLQNTVVAGTYTEPVFTTCINGTSMTHSAITPLIADFACQIRTDMGTALDVVGAISQQCLTDYQSNPNIIQSATTLAEDNHNKWIIICDMLQRVKFMEDNCCAPTCDDIFVGFSSTYNVGTQELTLTFSNAANTKIPLGFVDCGSTITLTDSFKNVLTFPITISNGGVWTSPSLGLDFTNPVSVKINTCLSNQINGLKCVDCFTQIIPAQDIECKLCKICTTGGSSGDQLSITYSTLSNPISSTVILEQGACMSFEIPGDAPNISSVLNLTPGSTMSLTTSADCPAIVTIPPVIGETCWFFPLPLGNPMSSTEISGFDCAANQKIKVYLVPDDTNLYEYVSLALNSATVALGGKTEIITTPGPDQYINTIPNASPIYSTPLIKCVSAIGTSFIGELPTGNYGTHDVCQGLVGQVIHPLLVHNTGGTDFGIYIKVSGQPTSVVPMLEIKDPINNQSFYSKGVLTLTCPC